MKRKAAPPPVSDTEEKPKGKEDKSKATPVNDLKLRRNRIVSDDEDDEEAPPPKSKPKARSRASIAADVLESDAERSLRAMMAMDDGEYNHHTLLASPLFPSLPSPRISLCMALPPISAHYRYYR